MTTVFLTSASTSPWTRPGDFIDTDHTVELLGCGGNGAAGTAGTSGRGGGSGAGGAYAQLTAPSGTLGSTTAFAVKASNSSNASNDTNATFWEGTSTTNSYEAQCGGAGSGTGNGPQASGQTNGTPSPVSYTTTFRSGGNGSNADTGIIAGGAGGAGAGGPDNAGGNGGAIVSTVTGNGGAGGGGANFGTAAGTGANANSTNGSNGGTGVSGSTPGTGTTALTGTQTAGTGGAGSNGGGGGGGAGGTTTTASQVKTGGAGGTLGNVLNWTQDSDSATGGAGGGGGGGGGSSGNVAVTANGGAGANYGGAGGGGGGCRNTGSTRNGGVGGGGLIVITYSGAAVPLDIASKLDGVGSLGAAMAQRMRLDATLPGVGSLTARINQRLDIDVVLAGAGTLSADLRKAPLQLSATFAGVGSLSADLQKGAKDLAATFGGSGSLTATISQRMDLDAALGGVGSLSADLQKTKLLAATFAGVGGLTVALRQAMETDASFNGAGSFSADAQIPAPTGVVHDLAASFNGSGALTVALRQAMETDAVLAGASTLSADLSKAPLLLNATFAGAGSLTASLGLALQLRATYSGVGTLSVPTAVNQALFATFQGVGSLTANANVAGAVNNWALTANFAGSGTLSASLQKTKLLAASFNGVGTLSATVIQLLPLTPDADSSTGGWLNEVDSVPLAPSIDEMVASDADYIKSSAAPAVDICKISLSDPAAGSLIAPVSVLYRYAKSGPSTADLAVRLLQGTTQISAWSHSGFGTSFVTVEQQLLSAEIAAITDWSDLFLEFTSGSALPSGVTLQAIDGGPTYYADHGFTHAVAMGWDNPSYFPIAVFGGGMSSDPEAAMWVDLNIDTLVSIGPSFMDANTFARFAANNICLVAEGDDAVDPNIPTGADFWVGNVTQDEATVFADVSVHISGLANVRQDNRWWYYNGNWFFFNTLANSGGLDPYEPDVALSTAVATPNATTRHLDLNTIDVYLFAGANAPTPVGFTLAWGTTPIYSGRSTNFTADESARGCHYGDMVDSMRLAQAAHFPAPIGNFIENGGPYTDDTTAASYIRPAEMNAAIWGSIIHGARWYIYFNHSFAGPAAVPDISVNNFALSYFQTIQSGEAISIYDQAKATNTLVKSLATVINSPFAIGYVTVSPPGVRATASLADSGFDVMAKYHNVSGGDNKFYIFAIPRYSRATTSQVAAFTVANTGATTATVINESRTISIIGGTTFSDTFATGNTVHIYRIDP